ncbi:MAG: hypothetical protein ACRBDL_01835 [Alphaproteobacteria bacterium]
MNIDTIGANPSLSRQIKTGEVAHVQNFVSHTDGQNGAKVENVSASNGKGAGFAASRISDAMNSVLLRLQETGQVFDDKDTRLMNVRGVSDQDRGRFAGIIQEAANNGAYNDPLSYIKSLSSDDVEVLRRVHSLAETSGVTGVETVEGAVNLLLPPHDQVDTNNDGFVNNGVAVAFKFPPPNAPQSVKDAWEAVTDNLSFEEKMMAEAAFFPAMIGANTKTDASGAIVGFYEPNDPEYTNIFGTSEASWRALISKTVEEYQRGVGHDAFAQKQFEILSDFTDRIDVGGSTGADEGASTEADASSNDSKQRFLDYMSKTPEERYYEALLAKEGLTKEQLAALPPEEQKEIEEKIKQKIEDDILAATGIPATA